MTDYIPGDHVEILVGGPHEHIGRTATVNNVQYNGDLVVYFGDQDEDEWVYSPGEVRKVNSGPTRDNEFDALALVLQRADVSADDLETTAAVLRKLALVELHDLCVPPGFNLLNDGSVGSVNSKTPEWQYWATAQDFVNKANSLEVALFRAHRRSLEIPVEGG